MFSLIIEGFKYFFGYKFNGKVMPLRIIFQKNEWICTKI